MADEQPPEKEERDDAQSADSKGLVRRAPILAPAPRTPLEVIDRRLERATAEELPELVRQRGELLKQQQWAEEMDHGREIDRREVDHRLTSERKQLNYKLGFGAGVFAVGTTLLVTTPLMYPALFCMGFGMYLVAPNYVRDVLKTWRGADDEE